MKTKQFKCEICKNLNLITRYEPATHKMVNNKKYYHTKLVCGRCYYKLWCDAKMGRYGLKSRMVGI